MENKKHIINEKLLVELLSANNKDFKFLLDQRDKGVKVDEVLTTAEAVQSITLIYLLHYCQGALTKEELIDKLTDSN